MQFFGLEKFIESTADKKRIKFDKKKIRASQINGCAFCIDMHNAVSFTWPNGNVNALCA